MLRPVVLDLLPESFLEPWKCTTVREHVQTRASVDAVVFDTRTRTLPQHTSTHARIPTPARTQSTISTTTTIPKPNLTHGHSAEAIVAWNRLSRPSRRLSRLLAQSATDASPLLFQHHHRTCMHRVGGPGWMEG